ncbi:unnamed protein product [Gongylonema pulchrum]|uniref:Mesencephalic astrocyte-derived neurotrophic factor homolog n=1 Tax=Gongylonema pulchrum TaxID=637853 RepID=A0A3P7QG48_9BILA|nr:unnamed protein product [Gongylonema pulchrum]
MRDVMAEMPESDRANTKKIDEAVREHCGGTKGKENKLCFYIGALPESATSIMNEVVKPLSWSMPVEKVCEKLRTMDSQICELEFDKTIDWKTACKGCTEKSEYVARIEELKPKYVKTEL